MFRSIIYIPAVLLMLFVTATTSAAKDSTEETPCSFIEESLIARHYPYVGWQIKDISYISDIGMCQVVVLTGGRRSVLYVSQDSRAVIAGEIFEDRKAVSQAALARLDETLFNDNIQNVDRAVAFSHKPAGATQYVYFFNDPDCAYCERAKEKVLQWSDRLQVEVRVVFYPLPMHPNAKGKAINGICSGMTYSDYVKGNYGNKSCPEGEEKLRLATAAAVNLNITGTPAFMGVRGKKAAGFNEQLMGGLL
jgi:thiol:disulfide interchange protein DsbC